MSNDLKKSNFFRTINQSGESIVAERALIVAGDAEQSLKTIVDNLNKALRLKTSEKLKLQDFGKKSNDSLEVVDGSFNSDEWAHKLHALSIDIDALNVELRIAQENYNYYFSVQEETVNDN